MRRSREREKNRYGLVEGDYKTIEERLSMTPSDHRIDDDNAMWRWILNLTF